MDWLMDTIRRALGMSASAPTMSSEQQRVAAWQRRIEQRQKAIDIQVEVLEADRRDARRR